MRHDALKRFGVAQLLNALIVLERSRLHAKLEVEFARRELWSLDRRWYDRDMLQAQSRA